MNRKQRTYVSLLLAIVLMLFGGMLTYAGGKSSKNKTKQNSKNGRVTWEDFFASWDSEEEAKSDASSSGDAQKETAALEEDGTYTSKDDVAAYLHEYQHLPDNYITKKQAQKLGWDSSAGNLNKVAPGKSIGGDRFGNYEELLPVKKGRTYYECDIDYTGGYRQAKRIIYSDDGLIYYTEDHYKTFTQLYDADGRVDE